MEESPRARQGEIVAEISREAIQILRAYTGRGPTSARTVLNSVLVAIVFADTLTKGEAKLVDLGKGEHVLRTRREYQFAMKEDLVAMVERVTGRTVIAFLSDNHLDPDIGVEAFVLEKESEEAEPALAS